MSVPVFQGKSASVVVAEGDALSAVLACDAACLVLAFDVFLFYLRGPIDLWTGFCLVRGVFAFQLFVGSTCGYTRVRNMIRLGDRVRQTYVTERAPDTGEETGLLTLANTQTISTVTRRWGRTLTGRVALGSAK